MPARGLHRREYLCEIRERKMLIDGNVCAGRKMPRRFLLRRGGFVVGCRGRKGAAVPGPVQKGFMLNPFGLRPPFLNGGDFDGMSGLGPLGHLFAVAFVAQPTTVKSSVPLLPVRVQLLATVTEPRFAPESATVAPQIAVFSVACHWFLVSLDHQKGCIDVGSLLGKGSGWQVLPPSAGILGEWLQNGLLPGSVRTDRN